VSLIHNRVILLVYVCVCVCVCVCLSAHLGWTGLDHVFESVM
jgi:hypothetical protein